jgi:hypothetical protein
MSSRTTTTKYFIFVVDKTLLLSVGTVSRFIILYEMWMLAKKGFKQIPPNNKGII